MEGEVRATEGINGNCILSLSQVFSDYRSHDWGTINFTEIADISIFLKMKMTGNVRR